MSSIDKFTYANLNSSAAGKRLQHTVNLHSDTTATSGTPQTKPAEIKPEQTKPAADGVTLTSQAQTLAQIPKQVNNEMPFDSAKVERLKLAINSGAYQVNPEKLAANLLKLESGSH
ncbi:MAG: flagellar biosynthesis anti-sigma factor FlgM [Plesiomonas sp.]|uniref:flagellar biosynthesis anti-sigma factor FlgM n=1 Tax=Plesiomonas sp. TaxID=2486279 RepID=UPI003EE78B1A